jgi:hypothetical protein
MVGRARATRSSTCRLPPRHGRELVRGAALDDDLLDVPG